jgi:CRISPR-associated endonuclease/helicase Cas3
MEDQFRFFRRVTMEKLGNISEEKLSERLKDEDQVLCILNTKKLVQRIYRRLDGKYIFHLSNAMYPKHRTNRIAEIKNKLDKGERCIVIATSLLEAGVDLDFQTVYRQVAGLDSIVQAAGRCNREGRRNAENSRTYIFSFDENQGISSQRQQIAIAEMILQEGYDLQDPATIQKYFEILYHYRGESLDKKRILEEFRHGKMPFRTVSKEFRLIENDTVQIIVPIEESAKNLVAELKEKGFSRERMRRAAQYCVQMYPVNLEQMCGCGMVERLSEDITDLYVLRDLDKYSEETGLELEIESGQALFL